MEKPLESQQEVSSYKYRQLPVSHRKVPKTPCDIGSVLVLVSNWENKQRDREENKIIYIFYM